MDAERRAQDGRDEAEFEQEIYLHSVVSHTPNMYFDIYDNPTEPANVEEFIPENPEDFHDMLSALRDAGWKPA